MTWLLILLFGWLFYGIEFFPLLVMTTFVSFVCVTLYQYRR